MLKVRLQDSLQIGWMRRIDRGTRALIHEKVKKVMIPPTREILEEMGVWRKSKGEERFKKGL
jgi:hypothetical protein